MVVPKKLFTNKMSGIERNDENRCYKTKDKTYRYLKTIKN